MFPETQEEKVLHKVFVWGILLKAFDGVVETLGGAVLFLPGVLTSALDFLMRNELIEDPHGLLATYVQHVIPNFLAQSGWFAALYLISHGLIKIALAVGLLRNKVWAYPAAIIVFVLFIAYQMLRYMSTHSAFLLVLTVFDLLVIWLTWHEYRYYLKYREFAR